MMNVRRTRLLPVIILGCMLAAVLLASAASGASETTGDVTGRVFDEGSGIGIGGVEVVASSVDGSVTDSADTNETGHYSFIDLAPGDYFINYSHQGQDHSEDITIEANGTLTLDFSFRFDDEDVAPGADDDDDDNYDDDLASDESDDKSSSEGMGVPIAGGLICAIAIGFILITMVVVVVIVIIAYNYSKISSTKLMNHDTRVQIYDHIDKNPGNHLRKIKRDLELPMGVLTHHISMMEREEVIKSRLDGQYRRYYPWNHKIEKKEWLSDMQNHIVKTVQENPGISPNKVAKALKISRNNAYYHTGELEAKGIIWIDRSGKSHKCFMKIDT